jgi:hypothetical protein
MAGLKRQDRKLYGEIQKFFVEELATRDDLGYPLHGEWEGYQAIHVYNDRYRVIWHEMPEIEDYVGAEDDTVVVAEVVRVGLKRPPSGGSVYERPPD